MKLGLPLFFSEGLAVCALTILTALLIASGRFDLPAKLGLLFGYFSGLLFMANIYGLTYGLRPDTQVALAWFLGLVLLEDGRLRQWELKRLFFGSLAITYASGLHYFAAPAFLGVLVYVSWAYKTLPFASFRKVTFAVAAGGCLFGLPYLFGYVVPNLSSILKYAGDVQRGGPWWIAITGHWAQYDYWLLHFGPKHVPFPLYYIIFPILKTLIPAFLVGSIFVLVHKQVRGFALASLPLCLFIFAYSKGKSAGYFLPELMVFFSGFGVVAAIAASRVGRRLSPRFGGRGAEVLLAVSICFCFLFTNPLLRRLEVSKRTFSLEMDIARAAAKEIVGDNALIGGRLGLWYISGATHWHDVAEDLLWRPNISDTDLERYFEDFDFIGEYDHMSHVTINSRFESIPSWYVSGLLRLKGFYRGQSHPNINFLLFDTRETGLVEGYVLKEDKLTEFLETRDGDWAFISLVCHSGGWPPIKRSRIPYFHMISLPYSEDGPRTFIVTTLLNKEEFLQKEGDLRSECEIRDKVFGRVRPVNREAMLSKLRATDQKIRFYRNLADIVVQRRDTVTPPELDLHIKDFKPSDGNSTVSPGSPITVTTAPAQGAFAAYLPFPNGARPGSAGWIWIDARVKKGRVGFGIFNEETRKYLVSRSLHPTQDSRKIYLPLQEFESADDLIIYNDAVGLQSEVVIRDVGVLVPAEAPQSPTVESSSTEASNGVLDKP